MTMLHDRVRAAADAAEAAASSAETEDVLIFPASSGQRRLWFIDQSRPGTSLYNISSCMRLRGPLDVNALRAALGEIVRRHESLRTTFELADGEPVQVVHGPLPLALDVEDLSSLPPDAREPHARQLTLSASREPFDLSFGPLFRASLLRLGPDDHVLALTIHHIISDGWSMGVLFNELAEIYNARLEGRPSSLDDLLLQCGDYAVWEQAQLAEPVLQQSLAHWARGLAGVPALNLPTDRPRPAARSYRGGTASRTIAPALAEAARAFARRHDATLFMTGLAIFAVLLHRYGGDEDIVLGAPVANRDRVEFQPLIGFFVNTVALRLNLGGDPPFRVLLHRVRQTTLEAFKHQNVPFDKVVEALRPDRKAGVSPVFQAMYAFESEWSPTPFRMAHLDASTWPLESDTAKFDLTLFLRDRPEGMTALLEYSSDLFDRATADRMLGHFQQALASVVENPDQTISRLPLLTDDERRQIILEWNRTGTEYPRDAAISDLVAEQAARRPDAIAVLDGDRRTSYRDLDRLAGNVAARLRRLGVGPGIPVTLCSSRGTNLIAAMLGVLKAGGVYVPLDPVYPQERLAALVADVGAPVALVESRYRNLFGGDVTVLDMDGATAGCEAPPASAGVGGADAAYIIFTSGSTGRPKGAIVPHRGIARLILDSNYVHFTEQDVVAQVSNAAFDAATFEVWGALLTGATLAILPTDAVLSARRLSVELRRSGVTAMFLTTSLFNQIVREEPAVFQSMRYVVFGGEAADAGAVSAVLAAGPPQHLVNGYGPTETTTFATTFEPTPGDDLRHGVPIGRPISNTTVYILDRHMSPVPIGVPGELYIGGDGVALGYHARPDLTAERFVADPFSSAPSARLYRTGDCARYREDGVIEFLGRLDHQVKIRGFRVEPGEIEMAIRAIPGVDEACVIADKDGAGLVRLTAYVGAASASATSAQIRERLKQTLPPYMVPSNIAVLDALPINANGKVDRSALRAIDVCRPASAKAVTLPRDPLESMLVETWERLLGVRSIGVRDDFFELGGHSLLAARMIGEVEQATGRRIPLSVLLQQATVESLANALVRAEYLSRQSPVVTLNERGGRRPLYFLHGDMNGGGFYTRGLAHHLGPERPMFVVPPAGAGGTEAPATIESMAAFEIERLRAVQPNGPYLLGGYCNGGLVALEMAGRLCAQGHEVPMVTIISAEAASTRLEPLDRLIRWWATRRGLSDEKRVDLFLLLQAALHDLAHATTRRRLVYVAARTLRLAKRLAVRRPTDTEDVHPAIIPDPEEVEVARHVPELYAIYYRAVCAYVPRRYDGRVALLLTGDPQRIAGQAADWRRAIPRLELHRIEGEHMTCITTHVASLAATLSECLASVEEPEFSK